MDSRSSFVSNWDRGRTLRCGSVRVVKKVGLYGGREDTHGVVERAPFTVDNHLLAIARYCSISGELLQRPFIFNICTVRSSSENGTEQAAARGVRSCKQGTYSLMGA